jgi:hypothetical protein
MMTDERDLIDILEASAGMPVVTDRNSSLAM